MPKIIGPLSRLGLIIAGLVFAGDQAIKYWLLYGLRLIDMPPDEAQAITPFFDLKMAWNHGVSYGFLRTENQPILIAISLLMTALLLLWLARSDKPLAAAAIGLVIGGALANALDRLVHGAVADFFYFHLEGLRFALLNFIFNPADVAIVAGVALLLYDQLLMGKGESGH